MSARFRCSADNRGQRIQSPQTPEGCSRRSSARNPFLENSRHISQVGASATHARGLLLEHFDVINLPNPRLFREESTAMGRASSEVEVEQWSAAHGQPYALGGRFTASSRMQQGTTIALAGLARDHLAGYKSISQVGRNLSICKRSYLLGQ